MELTGLDVVDGSTNAEDELRALREQLDDLRDELRVVTRERDTAEEEADQLRAEVQELEWDLHNTATDEAIEALANLQQIVEEIRCELGVAWDTRDDQLSHIVYTLVSDYTALTRKE